MKQEMVKFLFQPRYRCDGHCVGVSESTQQQLYFVDCFVS